MVGQESTRARSYHDLCENLVEVPPGMESSRHLRSDLRIPSLDIIGFSCLSELTLYEEEEGLTGEEIIRRSTDH